MRSLRLLAGLSIATVTLLLPTTAALEIEGDLSWRESARVSGILSVDGDAATHIVQRLAPGASEGSLAWTMLAERVSLVSSQREEPLDGLVSFRNHREWDNSSYEFGRVKIDVRATPAPGHGSSALYAVDSGAGRTIVRPEDGSLANVRLVEIGGDLMHVPASAREQNAGTAYAYAAPPGRLLEVTGAHETHLVGTVKAAFFGWTLTVDAGDGRMERFETGIRPRHDSVTGEESGTILEYVTLYAEGVIVALPSGDVPVYTPLLRYSGAAEFPEADYVGLHMEHAPADAGVLPLSGDIWLSTLEVPTDDRVRAWGDADWTARAQNAAAATPVAATATFGVFAVFAGLAVASNTLPAAARALRSVGFRLYARVRDQEPNANPTRERIYEAVIAEPGLNLSRIVERLDIGWGTAAYHVTILKRQGRVRELRFLNRVCFFPAESPDEKQQLQTVLLRQPNYREVMTVVAAQPGLSQREVAGRTGHARQYISRLVAKMERAGLLRTEPSRLGRRYFPTQGNAPDVPPDVPPSVPTIPGPSNPF